MTRTSTRQWTDMTYLLLHSPEDKSITGFVKQIVVVHIQGQVSRHVGIVRQAVVDVVRERNLMK